MLKKIITFITFTMISNISFAQDTSVPKFNQDFKVSAIAQAGCFINADNVNFGILQMPLTNVNASSDIRIKCTKNSPLVLNVILNNSSNGTISNNTFSVGQSWYTSSNYKVTIVSLNFSNNELFNINYTLHSPTNQLLGLAGGTIHCSSTSKVIGSEAAQAGFDCDGLYPTFQGDKMFSINPSHGELTGLIFNEKIKYSVKIPFNDSLIWSKGVNSYNVSGTGEEQTIPLKIAIDKNNNQNHRFSADTYQSILTLELNY